METVGYSTLQIIPSAKGFGKALAGEIDGPLTSAGKDAGTKAGGESAGGFMSSMSAKFALGMAVVGTAAAAVLTKGFFDAIDNEAASDKFAAQMGLGPAEQARLGDVAGKVYGNAFGESLGEVNEAIKDVFQNGLIPEDASKKSIENVTEKVLNLASAFDQDLSRTTAAAGTLIRTGLAADADEAFDIITRGFQQGADKGEDLLDTFIEYPSVLRGLGLSGEEATGLLVQGLQAGARNADVVADALKEFQIRATDASTTSAEGYRLIGLNAEEMTAKIAAGGSGAKEGLDQVLDGLRAMEGPVARNAAGVALFGTKWEDMGASLLALDVDTAVAQLGNVEGAATRMGDTLNDNVKSKLEAFKRQGMQKLTEFMGNVVIPAIEEWSPRVQKAFGDISTFVTEKVWPPMQQGFEWFQTNVWPRLVEGFKFVKEQLGNLVAFFSERWEAIKEAVRNVVAYLSVVWGPAIVLLKNVWKHIGDIVQSAWNFIKGIVKAGVDTIKGIIDVVLGLLTLDFDRVWNGIKSIISGVLEGIKAVLGLAWDQIRIAVGIAWDTIKELIGIAWDKIKELVGKAIDALVDFVKALPGRAVDALANFGSMLWDLFTGAMDKAKEIVSGAIDKIIDFYLGLPGRAVDALGDLAGLIGDVFTGAMDKAKEIVSGAVDNIGEAIGKIPGILTDIVGKVLDAATSVGGAVVDGIVAGAKKLVEGVGDIAGALVDAVKSVINDQVIDRINRALEFTIKGPGFLPDIHLDPPDIPRLHSGIDRVPGPPGSEMLAILQAGERVISASENRPGAWGAADGSNLDGAAAALIGAARALIAAAAAQNGKMSRSEVQRLVRLA